MTVRAVLFDVGGPIDTEVSAEERIDAQIRAGLAAEGIVVSDDEFAAACAWAVETFAPDAYSAIIWRLCAGDREIAARVRSISSMGRAFELREGIPELLRDLHGAGFLLGLAANQPARIVDMLDGFGIGKYFHHREVSEHHGYRKPDVRLFLRACDDLGVEPAECIMVGDRIDNDIVPARLLGMRTILLRTGRHIAQQPRCAEEWPDFEVASAEEIRDAIRQISGGRP